MLRSTACRASTLRRTESGLLRTGANGRGAVFVLCRDPIPRQQRVSGHGAANDREGKGPVQAMEEPMSNEKIPQTDSIQELARFWDAHDLTDFEEELEEVSQPVFERDTVVRIHLRAEEAEAIKRIAESKGVDYADLIRQWVVEKVETS